MKRFLPWLSTITIIAVIAFAWYLIVQNTLDPVRLIILASMACFIMSFASGVFAASQKDNEVTGNILGLKITLVGTLGGTVALLVILKFIAPGAFESQHLTYVSFQDVLDTRSKELLQEGWISFEEWKRNIGPVSKVYEGSLEEPSLRLLLPHTTLRRGDKEKPSGTSIDTFLFFYFDKFPGSSQDHLRYVKLQRTSGIQKKSTPIDLFHSSSSLAGDLTHVLFKRNLETNDIAEIAQGEQAGFTRINSQKFDAMEIAWYKSTNDRFPGKSFTLPIPMYTSDFANVSFCVASQVQVSTDQNMKVRMWEVIASPEIASMLNAKSDVPLMFRETSSTVSADWSSHIDLSSLRTWLALLDMKSTGSATNPVLATILSDLKKILGEKATWSSLMADTQAFPYRFSFALSNQTNSLISTFNWANSAANAN